MKVFDNRLETTRKSLFEAFHRMNTEGGGIKTTLRASPELQVAEKISAAIGTRFRTSPGDTGWYALVQATYSGRIPEGVVLALERRKEYILNIGPLAEFLAPHVTHVETVSA